MVKSFFSSIRLIFLLDTMKLKIEKSNIDYLKKYKGMVMNIMRFLVLIYIIFTIINILQGADSMFLYIQYCSRNCNHILSLMTIIGISRLRHNIK